MYRTIPTGNKICSTKETLQNQQILVNHLSNMRSCIDTKRPQKFQIIKIKNDKFRQVKQNEIDRENHHLLNKITGIMQNSQSQSHSTLTQQQQYKKSLNSNHRKNELIKIVVDNQALLKRIQDQRSKYDIKLWDQERKDVEKQIANICEYPFKDYKPNKTLVQFWNTSKLSDSQLTRNQLPKKLEPLSRNSELQYNANYQENQTVFTEAFPEAQEAKSPNISRQVVAFNSEKKMNLVIPPIEFMEENPQSQKLIIQQDDSLEQEQQMSEEHEQAIDEQ